MNWTNSRYLISLYKENDEWVVFVNDSLSRMFITHEYKYFLTREKAIYYVVKNLLN